jgi:hypothetical protein
MAPRTKYFIVAILMLGFVDGAIAYYLFPGQPFAPSSFVTAFVALFFVFWWYRLDSDSHTFRRRPLLSMAILALTIFAIPYYLFRTRGLRQGALATLVFLIIVVGYTALSYLGQLAVWSTRT